MLPGEVVDNRFELDLVAGAGAMGTVYRAIDRANGEAVAVKVLHSGPTERFIREIRVLAALRHPGIVRYIADGKTAAGELWLAMEWLDGENLAQRLARTGLTAQESVDLARRVAEALGAAHERHVVHRDVKPSNLFLPDGDLERVKVLDFGVARITGGMTTATRTGVIVGTPAYMAPEQVRGDKELTPRADVFAVGSVLFECLTGRPPFHGDSLMAVLAKIAMEDPPRLRELRPELPDPLDRLIHRVLTKQVDARPRDGLALAAELAGLGHIDAADRRVIAEPTAALTATERRLLSVALIAADADAAAQTLHDGATQVGYATGTGATGAGANADRALADSLAATSTGGLDAGALDQLRAAAELYGARLERLLDGSYVVTIAGSGGTADQVMQAARCALALKAAAPAAPMALATGRGMIAGRWPVGEAIDRAAKLLGAGTRGPGLVRLDEVTAGLLDRRFVVGGDDAGLYLLGERDVSEVARTLLGKETPCVGRDRELGVLAGLFEECVGEPIARAVLVSGPEGIGKSRVRYELLRRIASRSEPVEIWIGRGEPLRAGSPYGMIAPALRRAAGILDGEAVDVRRRKLRARVLRNESASSDIARTIAFLAELVGAPFPEEEAPVELRAARHDPMLMADQIRRAFEHLLAVETAAQPVVIVLEDLHWGDLPTVQLIDSALRGLADRPWMVLALARPDVHELFPRLWSERGLQEIKLDTLKKKGSEQLVRKVLGAQATDEMVARLVDQAGGNAFYLEELIRAVAEGKGDAMPETVLAVVQGRLERLEVDARRVLRAASVFGQQFWGGGVSALLGGAHRETAKPARCLEWIDELVARELVSRAQMSRFPGEDELTFRHAMVREAAYAMLTDADRRLGHQLAGDWLEKTGEGESVVLAEHFERGGELGRAIGHYRRAAEQALAACDFAASIARADRAVTCGARDEVLGALRLVQAEAHKWRGEFGETARRGVEAMGLLPRGSPPWFAAAGEAAEASGKLADLARLASIGEALRVAPEPRGRGEGLGARVTATAQAAFQLYQQGNYELAEALLDRVEKAAVGLDDPGVLARVHQARSSRAMFAGDSGAYLVEESAAAAAFERAGDLRYACMQRGHVGYACLELGAYEEGEQWLRSVIADATRMGLSNVAATARHNLGRALMRLGNLDEALVVETEAVEAFRAQGDLRLESAARVYLAMIYFEHGAIDKSEQELRRALDLVQGPLRYQILANLGRVLLSRGRIAEAYAAAREASDGLDQVGSVEEGEAQIRLMLAECLAAAGEHAAAREAIGRARARLLERAMQITDPARRRSFLEQLPEHARTLQLAEALAAR
jgi:tetratricopeptide (TPR) repeat protein